MKRMAGWAIFASLMGGLVFATGASYGWEVAAVAWAGGTVTAGLLVLALKWIVD